MVIFRYWEHHRHGSTTVGVLHLPQSLSKNVQGELFRMYARRQKPTKNVWIVCSMSFPSFDKCSLLVDFSLEMCGRGISMPDTGQNPCKFPKCCAREWSGFPAAYLALSWLTAVNCGWLQAELSDDGLAATGVEPGANGTWLKQKRPLWQKTFLHVLLIISRKSWSPKLHVPNLPMNESMGINDGQWEGTTIRWSKESMKQLKARNRLGGLEIPHLWCCNRPTSLGIFSGLHLPSAATNTSKLTTPQNKWTE